MIEQIISTFSSLLLKACDRYAKEQFVKKENIQIRFGLNHENEMRLTICKDRVAIRDEELGQIMGLKYLGGVPLVYGQNAFVLGAAPPFITKTLLGLCEEHSIEPLKIFIYAGVLPDGRLRLYLSNFDAYVCDMSLMKLVTGADAETE